MGRKILRMNKLFFADILSPGEKHYEIVKDALPLGTRIVKVSMDAYFSTDEIAFMLESPDWPEVPDCERIPEIRPVFQDRRPLLGPPHERLYLGESGELSSKPPETISLAELQNLEKLRELSRPPITIDFVKTLSEDLAKMVESPKQSEPASNPIKFREFT